MTLPASFAQNTFSRMIDFLNESNRIESITKINYQNKVYQVAQKGHFGALIDSQQSALEHKPLSIRMIKEWQGLLTREQLEIGEHIEEEEIGRIRSPSLPKNVRIGSHIPPHYSHVPTLLDFLVERINEGLKDLEKFQDNAEYCKFLGESFQEFESIHPFGDGNGRTGRLLANYIATYCARPIIVFNSEMRERNRYYDAHKSGKDMARFMAGKVQEVIFGPKGVLLFKKEALSETKARYQSHDGKYEEIYDWTALQPLFEEKKESSEPIEKEERPSVQDQNQDKENNSGISELKKKKISQDQEQENLENFFKPAEQKIYSPAQEEKEVYSSKVETEEFKSPHKKMKVNHLSSDSDQKT